MAIDRIARLRLPGVLNDFDWPADLPTFGRYNLIYGWNGTGKTTISRVFRALEMRTAPVTGEATLTINGTDVNSAAFSSATVSVRVFNRDFVNESVFPIGGGEVPPILVVGKESVEKQKQVEQLKKRLIDVQDSLTSKQKSMQHAERAVDKFCIDRAVFIKDTLRSSGINPYNNYDKSKFLERANGMLASGDCEAHRLSDTDRDSLLGLLRALPKPDLRPMAYRLPSLTELVTTVSALLAETVVSVSIQSLKNEPELSTWIRQGIDLHRDKHANECLFCEQSLPNARLEALESHFNAEFKRLLGMIDVEIGRLNDGAKAVEILDLPNRAEFYSSLTEEYDKAASTLHGAVALAKRSIDSLRQALLRKKDHLFEKLELDEIVPAEDKTTVSHLNEIIRKHNDETKNLQDRINAARQRLESDSIASVLDEFQRLNSIVDEFSSSTFAEREEASELLGDIAGLERDIVEHRQPAEELNNDLRRYLGHGDLLLEVKDSGYTITRNGVPARSLSEGETTAIALLYFLKTLKDRRFDLTKGVVVLDDPISSLDANALYLVFGFIRERTKDAAQLFILTHNFTFFRQVRNWFHHLKGQNKTDYGRRPARLYMLDSVSNRVPRCSKLRPLDRLLEKYESEYHYLFDRIYQSTRAPGRNDLEENYVLPNMARRLLEAFLAFRQPAKSGELWQKMQDAKFDESKKVRILRLLHTHSHGNAIGEPEHDPSLLSETTSVLGDLLEFIQTQDPGHYDAMIALVSPAPDGGYED